MWVNIRVVGALALAAMLAGCVSDDVESSAVAPQGETGDARLIYGADDRLEFYQLQSNVDRDLAASTAALMRTSDVASLGGGQYALNTSQSFGSAYNLCSSEPYRSQPSTAFCSGFVVGEDLIATAGHCIDSTSCGTTAFVFGFHMVDSATVRSVVPTNDVYTCAQVVARAETSTLDYAVVRVDRPIVGHSPLEIRRSGSPATGSPLTVSGHPAGIPLKVAGGATVRGNSHPDFFESNLDTYGGNSGSAVINPQTGVVEGILVRGNTDFVSTGKGRRRCNVSNQCSDSGCPGWEDVTRTTRFEQFVPTVEPQLCTSDAECDDGDVCNGAETCDLQSGACLAGASLNCDDGDACTSDSCDPSAGCANQTVSCNDGDACTVDVCDSVDGCDSTPVACDNGADGCCSPGCEAVDPDCDVPTCGLKRAACQANSDCCSNSCRRGRCR